MIDLNIIESSLYWQSSEFFNFKKSLLYKTQFFKDEKDLKIINEIIFSLDSINSNLDDIFNNFDKLKKQRL